MAYKPWVEKLKNAPKQYIQGWTEFYKLRFKLTQDVLIPRPETELLVDEVLAKLKLVPPHPSPVTILDVGTGSGCIAISIAKNSTIAHVLATDVSENALEVARENAKAHKVEDRIFFIKSDLLSYYDTLKKSSEKAKSPDIIVANLPYIPTARLKLIDPMVTEYEPRVALDGGYDGFELYRKLFTQMRNKNIIPKFLIAEIDYAQADIIQSEVPKFFPNAEFEIKYDLAKKQRILVIKFF